MAAFSIHVTDWSRDASRLSAVRRTVFIEEQGVPETMEWDAHDETAVHFLALSTDGSPIGCARLLPDGHLGRMAVLATWRKRGVGTALLATVSEAARARGHFVLKLSAQTHAACFYENAGFVSEGPEYMEAGIPHIAMLKIAGCAGEIPSAKAS